jgi:hypothetical protein
LIVPETAQSEKGNNMAVLMDVLSKNFPRAQVSPLLFPIP